MKFFIFLATFVFLLSGSTAHAALNLGGERLQRAAETGAGYAPAGPTSFASILGTAVKALLGMVGVLFMILIIYAGFLWMTARGNEQQVEKAETIIRSSVIGLIIVLGAYSITAFVVPALIAKTTAP